MDSVAAAPACSRTAAAAVEPGNRSNKLQVCKDVALREVMACGSVEAPGETEPGLKPDTPPSDNLGG